ncbi:MAG: phenylalanine--tRNA ligase subunit beta [Candidatus Levyibacteriota bacterium]
MDIKILDSWLREHLETSAKPKDIAKAMSLTSASIERVTPYGKDDFVYEIEITTNRIDMASVRGIAREASTVLPHFGYTAKLLPIRLPVVKKQTVENLPLHIKVDEKLINRVCCILLEVEKKDSPQFVKDRLEAAGIRSLNNLVDITNYVMLEIGHPAHVFDYDRLKNQTLIIRESKKGETIVTLDKKQHVLHGGDIVADNGTGEIVDLLGIMGTDNSVVVDGTKRILFFFDNNDPWRIRKTSMGLAIRTNAAAYDEKGVDPELAMEALLRGVELYKELANAKIISDVLDVYPHKAKKNVVSVKNEHIQKVIGVTIPLKQSITILESLGFMVKTAGDNLTVTVPTWRQLDVTIPEDIVEEVARIYGYHNIPTMLPPFTWTNPYHMATNEFYLENRVKDSLKYWGFTEVYTYSMVSETLFEGPLQEAVTLANPLDSEHIHMRKTLTPSLLEVLKENPQRETVSIFEIANTYHKKQKDLPEEIRTLCLVMKKSKANFYEVKGIVEQLARNLGIELLLRDSEKSELGADIFISKEYIGTIAVLENNIVSAELNFVKLLEHATLKKTFTPLAKYPPIIEDIALVVDGSVKTGDIIDEIKKQSGLIADVSLLDMYESSRTFHIVYQDKEKNLTTQDVEKIREKILGSLEKKFKIKQK